jgi:ABC-type multidrug transport system permease subunit
MIARTLNRCARAAQVAGGLGRRGTKAWITSPPFVIITLLFPLIFLAAFAGALAPLAGDPAFHYPGDYTTFVYGFVVLQAAAFGGVFTGYSAARDFELGFAPRIFLAVPDRSAILVGYVIVAVVRSLIAAAVVTLAALAGGMSPRCDLRQALLVVVLVVLMATIATCWTTGVAMRSRTTRAGPLMHTPVLIAMFLTPVYVPLELLGSWLKAVASVNPLTPFVEASRALLVGTTAHLHQSLAIAASLIVLLGAWALSGVRRAARDL